MEFVHLFLPVYWASYVMNGDASGIDSRDIEEFSEVVERENLGNCVDVRGESFFTWWHDAGHYGADCVEYIFQVKGNC